MTNDKGYDNFSRNRVEGIRQMSKNEFTFDPSHGYVSRKKQVAIASAYLSVAEAAMQAIKTEDWAERLLEEWAIYQGFEKQLEIPERRAAYLNRILAQCPTPIGTSYQNVFCSKGDGLVNDRGKTALMPTGNLDSVELEEDLELELDEE